MHVPLRLLYRRGERLQRLPLWLPPAQVPLRSQTNHRERQDGAWGFPVLKLTNLKEIGEVEKTVGFVFES